MASKSTSGRAYNAFSSTIDALHTDTTFTDRQRAAVQSAAKSLYAGLNGDSFAGKTLTITADVFSHASTPSMSVSLAIT